jgi:hypothetical protein
MRFAHVRAAAVTLLSGSFLTVGVLGTAQAAAATTANTDTACQALPSSSTPTPSPSPSPSKSPSPSPSPSPSTSSSASHSTAASAPAVVPASAGPNEAASPSPLDTLPSAATSSSGTSATTGTTTGTATNTTTGTTPATLDSYVAASPSAKASPADSAKANPASSTTAPPELCVSVQRSQSSIKRGQTATYVVQVTTQNGSASNVSVALTAQPASQKPTFTSGCAKGNGTATCTIVSVTTKQPASLRAQIAVAANATSVTSVKLTATASVATSTKWTPPAAAETTAVTAASATAKKSATSSPDVHVGVLPLGPIPNLNGGVNSLIGAGNAARLFPEITPSPGTSLRPSVQASGQRNTAPAADASPISADTPVFTAQVAGLIALGVAIMLTVTRLSVRKRPGKPPS